MRINFLVNEVQGGWEPTDKRLGGTEESVREWAKELSIRGHEVAVYHNKRENIVVTDHGAHYYPREMYQGDRDVCINIKSSEVAPQEPTLYLTNEVDADKLDLSAYDGVIWPSKWARDNIPVNNKTFILPHGYDDKKINSYHKKISKQCLYASSPDRGLDTLLRAWPSVVKAHPDATLIVTYNAPEYDIPGVTFMDATEDEMNELYNISDIWCHPANGGELYCMTGIKAQAAGCVPVYNPVMALKETVRHGYYPVDLDYMRLLVAVLSSTDEREEVRKQLAEEHYPTWSDSTDRLLEIINTVV